MRADGSHRALSLHSRRRRCATPPRSASGLAACTRACPRRGPRVSPQLPRIRRCAADGESSWGSSTGRPLARPTVLFTGGPERNPLRARRGGGCALSGLWREREGGIRTVVKSPHRDQTLGCSLFRLTRCRDRGGDRDEGKARAVACRSLGRTSALDCLSETAFPEPDQARRSSWRCTGCP